MKSPGPTLATVFLTYLSGRAALKVFLGCKTKRFKRAGPIIGDTEATTPGSTVSPRPSFLPPLPDRPSDGIAGELELLGPSRERGGKPSTVCESQHFNRQCSVPSTPCPRSNGPSDCHICLESPTSLSHVMCHGGPAKHTHQRLRT